LSEYGAGRVFLGGGTGKAAGWRMVSEPALRLSKELLGLTFEGVVELCSCSLLCFSVGFWTWLWSCSIMDLA